jgi:ubiquinone/menaquinone biosynthesis C-methylase UbiE
MNFDPLARYYDTIAGLVYWGAIQKSQLTFLDQIKRRSNVLIVGGGTGWILNYLPSECASVTYIEPSREMMKFSRNRKVNFPVKFIQSPIENTNLQSEFDVIITNFFFDQFDEKEGKRVARKLKDSLKENGTWILTDFEDNGQWWQTLLLRFMYTFFVKTTGLRTYQLVPWKNIMNSIEMKDENFKSYFGNFIVSVCYR